MNKATDVNGDLVRNPEKLNRYIDYSGLNQSNRMKSDSVYATDFDSVMEFSDKFLIITEIKERGLQIRDGQRWTLERVCDAWVNDGKYKNKEKHCFILHAQHSPDLGSKIPVGECEVVNCYVGNEGWRKKVPPINLIECLHKIGDKYNIKKLKKCK